MSDEPQTVRLVVLGDPDSAPVCEGDSCHLPPLAVDAPTPPVAPDEGDRPQ